MQKDHRKLLLLSAIALASALLTPGIFMWGLFSIRVGDFGSGMAIFAIALRLAFVLAPAIALIAAAFRKSWSIYPLLLFSVLAWVFGSSPLPLVSHLFSVGYHRSVAITIITLAFAAVCSWVRWHKSNNSFKRTPATVLAPADSSGGAAQLNS